VPALVYLLSFDSYFVTGRMILLSKGMAVAKNNGWVKIHRKILLTQLTASQFKFFVGAILLAKSPNSPGSGLVNLSVRELGRETGMDSTTVWRIERELVVKDMITMLDKGFIIKNYYYYQTGKVFHGANSPVSPDQQQVFHRANSLFHGANSTVSPDQQFVSPDQQQVFHRANNTGVEKDNLTPVATKKEKNIYKKEKNIKEDIILQRFDIFWKAYPLKVAKGNARKAFVKLNPDDGFLETILRAVERAKQSDLWLKGFIKHPATWLNAESWEDEVAVNEPKRKSKFGDGW